MGKVAILGAGNGGCAAAVDLSLRDFEVSLFDLFPKMLEPIKEQGGLRYTGSMGEGFCELRTVSNNLAEVINDASLIMVNVPGPGHKVYAKALAPFLKAGDLVLMNPGHTGGALHFVKVLKDVGVSGPIKVSETNTLSYISRLLEPGYVKVTSHDKRVMVSVFPALLLDEIAEIIHQYFPNMVPVTNVLVTSFSNVNAICHPPGMILNAGWIEKQDSNFRFYYDGISPAVGDVIDKLDQERIAIAKALGVDIPNFAKLFYSVGSTTKEAAAAGNAYKACQESEPNKFILAPDTLDHRYMHEDLNSGLVPMAYLGRFAGVPCPVIDSLIELGCALMKRNYWKEGLGLKEMGLEQVSFEGIIQFLYKG